jgi:DNA-directed RNA polymerase
LVGFYREPQIKIHPLLASLFGSDLIFESNRLPMISSPMPWFSPSQGGYFLSKSNLLRLKSNASEQINLVEKTHPSHMYSILDSLNALSSCPWRINARILDLTIDIFKKNGNKDLDIPEHAEFKGPEIPKLDSHAKPDKKELKAFYKQKEASLKIKAEMHSQWCSELYRLSIANMFRDKVIWFPHSLDFRGRTYPIPPHFNHLGSDLARSLIVLAEGKKLGPSGLDTLKIHLINLTGTMKKSTIKERLDFANSIIEDIVDSAEKPFEGKCWWQKSEEKWQTLACCMEIADAIKSKNAAEFVSHFPIHQDGSCNGLQHYAALGRDQEGALSVRLVLFYLKFLDFFYYYKLGL